MLLFLLRNLLIYVVLSHLFRVADSFLDVVHHFQVHNHSRNADLSEQFRYAFLDVGCDFFSHIASAKCCSYLIQVLAELLIGVGLYSK